MKNYSKLTEIAYDEVAQKYFDLFNDEMNYKTFDCELLKKFSSLLNNNADIIDLGCGPCGHITKYLKDLGNSVTGIDISEECVNIAKTNNPDILFKKMDMHNLSIEDNRIDGIVAYYSIIHTPKQYVSKYFQDFHRILKKNGKLLLSVKSGEKESLIENFLESDKTIHFTHFTKEEIENYFQENEFRIIFLEERSPYPDEINVNRIFAIGEKI